MAEEAVRTTIILPADVAEKFRKRVPARKRSEFITDLVRQAIERQEFLEALDRAFGICKDEDYPHWRTPEDVRNYVREMRDPKNWRRTPLLEE